MSRKTRNEKKMIEYRKKAKLLQQLTTPKEHTLLPQTPVEKHKELPNNQTDKFFIQDLRKSLLLIFLIITLEIVFYFVTMNGYLGNLLKF